MKLNKKWTTIIESIIVMVIVTIWVVWMYNIYNNSQKISDASINRVQAVAIAREWIEAFTNIRDTNWLLYANKTNCWNTYNYNSSCMITDVDISTWSYIIYKNSSDRWNLEPKTTWVYSSWTYRNDFKVMLDGNWFYTQTWWITEIKPLFTREIKISYPSDTWTPTQKINIESIVRWSDSSRNTWNFEVKLETVLTNWKK